MNYRKRLFNQKSLVLFENKMKNKDLFFGRDEFQNSVVVKNEENLKGKIKEVEIINGNRNTLFGQIKSKMNNNEYAA